MLRPAAIFVAISLAAAAQAQTPGFWFLPVQSGERDVTIRTLSRDGTRAGGGISYLSNGPANPFLWTAAGGRQVMPLGTGQGGEVDGISTDGQITTGTLYQAGGGNSHRPYLRVGMSSPQVVPLPPGFTYGYAAGSSDDGNVIAGTWWRVDQGSPYPQPFMWTPGGGTVLLGQLNDLAQTSALSRDGTTAVGISSLGSGFVWRRQTGFQWLAPPPISYYDYGAVAVNTDGSIIVGKYSASAGTGMVRWISGIPQDLGIANVEPIAIGDDGRTIAAQPNSITPYVWTEQAGLLPANAYFQNRGVALPPGLTLYYMKAMSPDGRTFAGTANLSGTDGAFVVTVAMPCGSADFNNDGDSGTDADIEAFFACLAGTCCATCGSADFNGDGDTGTDSDIESFFRVLSGGTC